MQQKQIKKLRFIKQIIFIFSCVLRMLSLQSTPSLTTNFKSQLPHKIILLAHYKEKLYSLNWYHSQTQTINTRSSPEQAQMTYACLSDIYEARLSKASVMTHSDTGHLCLLVSVTVIRPFHKASQEFLYWLLQFHQKNPFLFSTCVFLRYGPLQ